MTKPGWTGSAIPILKTFIWLRFRRLDHETLTDEITVEDAKAYTKPWTARRTFQLKPKWQLMEFVCQDQYLNFQDYLTKTLGK